MGNEKSAAEMNGIGDEGLKQLKAHPVENGGAGRLPTVRIKHADHPNGLIINASEFNAKTQKLFDAPDEDEEKTGGEGGDGSGAGGDGAGSDLKGGSGANASTGGGNPPAGDKGGGKGNAGGKGGKK